MGGGLAGLAAAYHLVRARPGLDLVLVEAGRVGGGASGRSTGMVGPGVGGSIVALRRRFGDALAARMFRASLDAVRATIRIIREERLACDLEIAAQLRVALTARQAARLGAEAAAYADLGFDVPALDACTLVQTIGTAAYRGGLRFECAALVNPLALAAGLARLLERRGVRIYEGTPALAVRPGAPARVETPRGTLAAGRVVVATDAYSGHLRVLAGRVVPLHTHAILTEPLPPAARWPGREAVVDARNFFSYYRLTPEGRILMGGGRAIYRAGAAEAARPREWARLERELRRLFPALAGVRIERRWAGPLGFTLDGLPVVGALARAPGVLYAGGWCGHGIALSFAAGARIADLILAPESARAAPRLPWHRGRAPLLPPEPLRGLGVGAALIALDLADRLQASGLGPSDVSPVARSPRPEAQEDAHGPGRSPP